MSQLEWISATCNPRAFNKTHIWALVLFPDAVFTKGFCWISLLESQGLPASLFTYLYVREAPGKHPSLYQTENKEMGYKGEEGTVPAFGRGSESFIGGISFWKVSVHTWTDTFLQGRCEHLQGVKRAAAEVIREYDQDNLTKSAKSPYLGRTNKK